MKTLLLSIIAAAIILTGCETKSEDTNRSHTAQKSTDHIQESSSQTATPSSQDALPALRTFGQAVQKEPSTTASGNNGAVEDSAPHMERQAAAPAPNALPAAHTAEEAILIVESLDPDNYTAFHDSSEYDITTVDGAYYYFINYTAGIGMGGSVFVQKDTGAVFGYTYGTEDDPNAPFPDFSIQIK